MECMELENAKSRSKAPRRSSKILKGTRFVLCLSEMDGVEKGKVYRVIPDAFARQHELIRIVDDSQDDYLFPVANFIAISIPRSAEKHLQRSQTRPARRRG
jgi:hypothetical protein